MKKLLFVIGMQKSGTSLLNRALMFQEFINNPFLPEGKHFWGDNPPFNPVDEPCGKIFQKHKGLKGHVIDESDYSEKDKLLLYDRIINSGVTQSVIMNKNPYNTVRISWLKAMFPNAVIVAIFRNPVSNIYSLLKKYQPIKESSMDQIIDWWGIKPDGWKGMVNSNKLIQSIEQWSAVNRELINFSRLVDLTIDYASLCSEPNSIIRDIVSMLGLNEKIIEIPELNSFNDEYLKGSKLESKNKQLRTFNNFNIDGSLDTIEFPALNRNEVLIIQKHCSDLWEQLQSIESDISKKIKRKLIE